MRLSKIDNLSETDNYFLNYSLEIMHYCLSPEGFEKARIAFGKLEKIVGKNPHFTEKVEKARNIFENKIISEFEAGKYKSAQGYYTHLSKIIKTLIEASREYEELSQNKKKRRKKNYARVISDST